MAIVGSSPSCLLTLRDEYVDLLRTDEARMVAQQSCLLEQFLLRERERGLTLSFKAGAREALLHGHCHQKAIVGTAPTVAVLKWAGYRGERGRLGLLRHGGLVRLRARALRRLRLARATGAWPRR